MKPENANVGARRQFGTTVKRRQQSERRRKRQEGTESVADRCKQLGTAGCGPPNMAPNRQTWRRAFHTGIEAIESWSLTHEYHSPINSRYAIQTAG